jgi:predicted signal transduction protein with EAL and GGDEF domain
VVGLVRQAGFEHAARGDVAARLGGDEFGVLLTGVPDPSYAIQTADRLLATFDAPIEVAWQTTTAGASIGIALDTAGTIAVDDLLGQADIAMYRAKAQGKGRSHLFSPDDVLDNEAVARRIVDRDTSDRRGISFRKPTMGRPALGQEPG